MQSIQLNEARRFPAKTVKRQEGQSRALGISVRQHGLIAAFVMRALLRTIRTSRSQELLPEPLSPANLARAAQLTQRCNQFNMRGTRHTEAELAGKKGWVYRLRDRFGDLGTVGVVVLEGDFIETWALSCRALNRGVERLILDHLKAQGPVRGQYVPTARNGRCANVYKENGVPTC